MDEKDTTTSTDVAETQAQETEQPETQDTQAVEGSDTQEVTEKSTDEETLEWAKKKGLPMDDPVKLAKMVRESETKMHEATTQVNKTREVVQANSEAEGQDETSQLVTGLKVFDFFTRHPEARDFDEEMAKVIDDKPHLANDLEAVYDIARVRSIDSKLAQERKAGRKEALQQVAKAENASAPRASATTRESKGEITDEDIGKMTPAEYTAWKQETGFNPFA